jgi:hypothetical protein
MTKSEIEALITERLVRFHEAMVEENKSPHRHMASVNQPVGLILQPPLTSSALV